MSILKEKTILNNIIFNNVICDIVKFNNIEVFRRKLVLYDDGKYGPLTTSCSVTSNREGWLERGSNYVQCNAPSKSNSWTTGYLSPAVDITKYNKLSMRMYCGGFAFSFGLQTYPVASSGGGGQENYGYTRSISGNPRNGAWSAPYNTTGVINISDLSGKYYITFTCAGSSDGYNGWARLYSAILEI